MSSEPKPCPAGVSDTYRVLWEFCTKNGMDPGDVLVGPRREAEMLREMANEYRLAPCPPQKSGVYWFKGPGSRGWKLVQVKAGKVCDQCGHKSEVQFRNLSDDGEIMRWHKYRAGEGDCWFGPFRLPWGGV